MKHLAYSLTLLVALLLTGCSSSHDTADGPTDILQRFNAEGNAYMHLVFTFPASDTRAGNGTFDTLEPTDKENLVYNAKLLLFHGKTTEDEAVLCSYYTLAAESYADAFNGEQSQMKKAFVQKIDRTGIETGDNLYLLLVLNASSQLTGTTLDAWNARTNANKTFSKLKTELLSSIGSTTTDVGFLMSNAPVASKPGGDTSPAGATITTLTKIIPERVFPSKEEAQYNPAADIYVERAATKIKVALSATEISNTGQVIDNDHVEVALDRYNTAFRLTRQFQADWLGYQRTTSGVAQRYRMVDAAPISPLSITPAYRTYWGADNNYSADTQLKDDAGYDASTGLFDIMSLPNINTAFHKLNEQDTYYCAENTMSHDKQTLRNTTALIVRIKVQGSSFYTISVEGSVVYNPNTESFEEDGTSADQSLAPKRRAADDYIRQYLTEWLARQPEVAAWLTANGGDASWLNIVVSDGDVNTGICTVTASQKHFAAGSTEDGAFNACYTNLNTYINSHVTVKQYKDGYCYYRVPIRHFGNDLTPWIKDAYTTDHLGRFGVVRNNWYNIDIVAVNRMGEPVIPPANNDPDDKAEEALSLKVNIMPWLHQGQDATF